MSTEQLSSRSASHDGNEPTPARQDPGWGGNRPGPGRRWSGRRTAAAIATAAVIAGAGGFAIYAASGSTDSTDGQGGPGGAGGPGGQGGPGGAGGTAGGADALHGEYVVSDGNGGYTTELTQTGEVTAISATSITTVSTDGFTRTYTIDALTAVGAGPGASTGSTDLSGIATGDTVSVVATASGDTATVESLSERTASQTGGQGQQAAPPAAGN